MNEHVDNGLKFLDDEEWGAAEAAFGQALAADPDDVDAAFGHAQSLKGLGRNDEAIAAFRSALERETRSEHTAALAELLLLGGEPSSDVQAMLATAIEHDPAVPQPYMLLAELHTRANELGEAEQYLRQGVRRGALIAPSKVFSFYQHFAGVLVGDGDVQRAAESLGRAAQFFGLAGGGVELIILAAGVTETTGDAGGAIALYKEALTELAPGNLRTQVLEKIAALV